MPMSELLAIDTAIEAAVKLINSDESVLMISESKNAEKLDVIRKERMDLRALQSFVRIEISARLKALINNTAL